MEPLEGELLGRPHHSGYFVSQNACLNLQILFICDHS